MDGNQSPDSIIKPSTGKLPVLNEQAGLRKVGMQDSMLGIRSTSLIMANSRVSHTILERAARLQILGKSPIRLYLRLNKRLWQRLPDRIRNLSVIRSYGAWLHALVCLHANRQQYFGTFFFRNRPSLELIRRLAEQKSQGATLSIAVLACSIGAEVYSILWTIRSARPDLKIHLQAVDVSKEILDFAAKGIYSPSTSRMVGSSVFDRMTEREKREMFDWAGDQARVKSWLREGITWRCGDVNDPELVNIFGLQDVVVGSNFLCHMAPVEAETCLRNIARLVGAGGHLFVTGVDLDVRARVALGQGWKPLPELLAEIHEGDPSVRADWPWQWWGLEPFDQRRSDWQVRYATVFQVS